MTTKCEDCDRDTGRRHARYCDDCRPDHRGRRRKWLPTLEIDRAIREAWQGKAHGTKAYRVVQLRTKCGWPKWRINRRAIEIGVARRYPKERAWSEQEIKVLRDNAWRGPDVIQRKLRQRCGTRRTLAAIVLKRKRLRLLGNRVFYSATHVSDLLGVDQHKVKHWILAGWLTAQPRGTRRSPKQGGDIYRITPAALKRFVFEHAHEIDLAKVEKWWFLELVSGGKLRALPEEWRPSGNGVGVMKCAARGCVVPGPYPSPVSGRYGRWCWWHFLLNFGSRSDLVVFTQSRIGAAAELAAGANAPEFVVRFHAAGKGRYETWTGREMDLLEEHASRDNHYVTRKLREAGYRRTVLEVMVRRHYATAS